MKKIFVAIIAAFMLFTAVSINIVKAEEESNAPVVDGLFPAMIDGRNVLAYYDSNGNVQEYPGYGVNYFININKKDYTVNVVLNNFKLKFYGNEGISLLGSKHRRLSDENEIISRLTLNITLVGNNSIQYVDRGYDPSIIVAGISMEGGNLPPQINASGDGPTYDDLLHVNFLGDGALNIDLSESHAYGNYGMNLRYAYVRIYGPIININLNTQNIYGGFGINSSGRPVTDSGNLGIVYGGFEMDGGALNISAYENRATVSGLMSMITAIGTNDAKVLGGYSTIGTINGGVVNINIKDPNEGRGQHIMPVTRVASGITVLNGAFIINGGSTIITVDDFVYAPDFFGEIGETSALVSGINAGFLPLILADKRLQDGDVQEGDQVKLADASNAEDLPEEIVMGRVNVLGGEVLISLNNNYSGKLGVEDYAYGAILALRNIKANGVYSAVNHEYKFNIYYPADAFGNALRTVAIKGEGGGGDTPSKKEGTCEEVHGPTWHWNNDKKVCEEVSVVGTATR